MLRKGREGHGARRGEQPAVTVSTQAPTSSSGRLGARVAAEGPPDLRRRSQAYTALQEDSSGGTEEDKTADVPETVPRTTAALVSRP